MTVDIAPEILNDIMDSFEEAWHDNKKLPGLMDKLKNGTATYVEANEYAAEVGRMMKEAYAAILSSDRLPDGKCYYNIADKIIRDTEHMQYTRVTDYTMKVQQDLNKKAGIGLKAIAPEEDKGLVQSLINKAANADQYDDVAAYVSQTMESMSKKVVDHSIKANADFQYKAGMRPKIIRSGGSGCCEWCSGLSGKYDYPDVPPEVYARHNNCSCTVEYVPGDGKRQNVWNKSWISEEEAQRREELKTLGLDGSKKYDTIKMKRQKFNKVDSFDSKADPMADAFGPGIVSNPKEIEQFRRECAELGVEVFERENEALGYYPSPVIGHPGQISVSKGASYSAWCHEMQHMYDDRDSGWIGSIIAWDRDEHYEWEKRAYGIEIDLAEKLGRPDIADKLRENLKEEKERIYGND